MKKTIAVMLTVAVLTLMSSITALAATPQKPQEESSFYAADYAEVLSDETEAAIVAFNQTMRTTMGAELVVVTTPDTGEQAIAD